MSVENFILRSFKDMKDNDFEMAFYSLIPAIDSTAKKRYPNLGVGARTKKFLRDEISNIIVLVSGLEINFSESGGVFYGEEGKEKSFEHWVYKLIRNPLVHEAKWPNNFNVTNDSPSTMGFGYSNGVFEISANYITHLPFVLIGAKENKHCDFGKNFYIRVGNSNINLNDYWGKIEELIEWRKSH